ncbi:reverse transcriptase [Tanacetum coccineum]|uniref:Reverse transcriptase n=1 Tax=Tanacetum coccineum TaxID=301880 RepID=A0ABQ4XA42_9ASTR
MNEVQNFKTMRVKGTVGKHILHILVDYGSTHNFVDIAVAKKLGCHIRSTCLLSVTMGDGYNIATTSECKQFHWQLQGVDFWSDVMLFPRGGSDMVLGIQWLSSLGDIKCNFKDLRMEFVYKNKKMLCVFPSAKISLMRMEGTSPDLQPELQSVVEEFDDVFAIPKELPLKAIENMVQEILDTGVIRQSNSPFAFPIVMVKKKDNTWRMCVDYRQLNKNTIKDKFPIPIIEELIDELRESQIFSKLDLR